MLKLVTIYKEYLKMGILRKNQKGFSTVEVLLILVIVGALSLVGWYVWHSNKSTLATHNTTSSSSVVSTKKDTSKKSKTPVPNPYAGWKIITTNDKVITLKIPAAWTSLNCPTNDTSVYSAPTSTTLAKCGSENVGEVGASYINQDLSANEQKAKGTCDSSFVITQTTVNASPASRVEIIEAAPSDNCIFNTQGSKDVAYSIFNGGKSYYFNYRQLPNGTDDLATFELIVKSATW